MPIFVEQDGKKYNVREEHIDSFMKRHPDATSKIESDGKKYRVKSIDYKTFMSRHPVDDERRPADTTTTQGPDKPVRQEEQYQPTQIQQAEQQEQPLSPQKPTAGTEWRAPMLPPDDDGQNEDNTIPSMLPNAEQYMHEAKPDTDPAPQYEVETANREQVVVLTDRIHEAMNVRGRQLDAEANDRKNWWADMPHGPGGAIFTHNSISGNGRLSDMEYRSLSAANNAMRNAQALINEADAARRDDKLHDWAATKFVKGAARGLGEKLFDARTWDLGLTDVSDNLALATALNAYENGEPLTESQQMMLDAKAVELATNAYFGSYVGRGYKAGTVTAESIPFMIEMCINPASTTGSAAVNKLTRYAIKRFGTRALRKNAGKYVAAKTAARVAGDIAGSMTMTATTGAGRTTADAIDRMNGNLVYDTDDNGQTVFGGRIDGEDFGTAFSKAFAATTIENYSEMFGNYFSPVLGAAGKGIRKGFDAVGLGRVNRFIDDAAMSDVGRLVTDFEKSAQWNGLIGEYAEEVAGGIMNALVVGDQTLDADENTGVFNLDQNIDTFLGVSLMGGFLSSVKTVGYRTPKYRAKKTLSRAERNAANTFSDPETWESIRGALESEENMPTVVKSVLADSYNDDQKRAVLSYVEAKQAYDGTLKGEVKRRFGGEELPEQVDAEQSFDNGYSLETPQEMQDARNMLDYQRQKMLEVVGTNEEALNDDSGINWISEAQSARNSGDEERAKTILDYLNAKATYDGMIQRVRDDIDGRIEQSNSIIATRVHRDNGMIQPATMKDNRHVYIISGNLRQYADKSGIDNKASDSSIIIRDAETGALEQVAPDAILNIEGWQDANEQKQIAEQQIRQQFAQEAADKIDGVASFNPGDTYTVAGEQGEVNVQIVANEAGIVDNGDGTVNATTDGTEIITIPKDVVQQQVDAANIARVAEFEQARAEENLAAKAAEQEVQRPTYTLNDTITLRDETGNSVRGSITADADADGRYEVYTENPINGRRVNLFTREELDSMVQRVSDEKGNPLWQRSENDMPAIPEDYDYSRMDITEQLSAMQRIPKDEQGNPLYEQADSDTAWDAIVEQTEGDEAMAQTVANGMVADKEAALKKAEKAKSKGGTTIAEKIASEKERAANIAAAKQELDIWKKIANVSARRKADIEAERSRQAQEAAAARKVEEERSRAEREEAERIEREALKGVPDIVNDTPKDARARGYRRVSGHKINRQERLQPVQGKSVAVKFSNDAISNGRVAIIDASQLQPSHIQGQRNPLHFIDEAQPKERNDQASVLSATKIAGNIRPEEITSSVTAYTGAPTVNARGEVIQGNNRSYSLRLMWKDFGEQAERYRQYLKDNAADFGLTADDIDSVPNPVLVNMIDVDDDAAITLGQYVAQDTESGGIERIKPKNTLQKMGANMRNFANMLLKSTDDETSFAGLVDRNGADVLKWMNTQGFITATQFKSAFDSKGNLTPEAKNDLRGIMYNSIFQGGSTLLEEMFNAMPAKAQKAILSTAYRDYDSPSTERMVAEIQNSIRAYHALSQDKLFAEATNFKDARIAVENWKRQYQIDDATGESYLPAENFSNFALHLATMYKGGTQSFIQGTFNKLFDLIQGTQEENLFEQPDNTPRSLAQAIYEVLNFEYDGQHRSNLLAGDSAAIERGELGSDQPTDAGERVESGTGTADDTGSVERGSESGEVAPTLGELIEVAEAETDTNPTDAQKAAGNYKKGHIQVGTFNVTVENPKGSVRSGVDASGREWQTTMNNTYGYIRGTEGVDGDHIDVFLSDDIDGWNGRRVFVIDQYNTDGTFDEHKVMLGFNSEEDATAAYLSNYEKSWADDHKTVCSSVIIEEFEKWIDSSHRKIKPFADYKTVKHESVSAQEASTDAEKPAQQPDGYTVEKRFHKKNNTDIYAVKFTAQMPREQFLELKKRVKDFGGYYSSFGKGGFIFDTEADANRFAQAVLDLSGESLDDAAPLSLKDIAKAQEVSAAPTTTANDDQALETAQHETAPKNEGAFGLVSDERMAELREQLRKKMLGQLNAGFDPEILSIGLQLTAGYIDRGVRKFADYAKQMIEDFGDVIRPYLKAFYNGARDLPDVVSTGLADEMTPYDEVSRFDIANFDKNSSDPFATAEMVVAEQEMQAQAADAKQQIIDRRNTERRKENEQTTADTLAIAEEAEVVASEAETLAETATDEREINRAVEQIDETLGTLNGQLALLGYYEFDEDDSKFHESYGYMLTAEKKAVKDATNLAKQLVEDLGIEIDEVTSSTTPLKRNKPKNTTVSANIAPAGGEVTIRLPLKEGRELALYINLDPVAERGSHMRGDNLMVEHIMYRIEKPSASGDEKYGINQWVFRPQEATYAYLLQLLRGEARQFLPGYRKQTKEEQEQAWRDMVAMADRGESPYTVTPEVEAELAKQREDEDDTNSETVNGYKRGDEVMYDRNGTGKWEKQRIVDFEDGRPVLDSFGASWITEIADWERIKPVDGVFGEAERITRQMSEKKSTSSAAEKTDKIAEPTSEVKKTSKKKVAADATIGNLFNFASESKTENNDGNDIRRNDAVRTERLSADSRGHEKRLSERIESGSESEPQDSGRTDGRGTAGSPEQHRAVRPRLSDAITTPKNTNNNHSERGADHAPTSVDARIDANIKAIELSRRLIENGDRATPEQMKVLRKFSGWGGLGKAFSNDTYSAKIQELLGKEEYDAATMSANSSYYTPAYVVDTLWDIAQQLGFEGGNILEGSAGIGNILGQMPTSISERSDIHAVEIDPTSGGILSLLYPDAQVDIQGFEQTRIQNGSVDLAITNVPFVTGLRVNDTTSDKDLSRKFHNIHDFCIAKNVRKLRPGGIGIFITSNGTLDGSKKLRDWVVNEGGSDFIGAFRMNNKTFGGTAVTSDIIVIRKRVNGRKSSNAIDVSGISGIRIAEYDTGETRKVKGVGVPVVKKLSMDYNKYFIDHPENMAGEMSFAFEHNDTFRPTSKGLYPTRSKNQEQMLSAFVQSFVAEQETSEETSTEDNSSYVADASADGRRLGELYEKDGQLVVSGFGGYYPLDVNANKVKGHTKVECFNAYAEIKKALADVMDYQTNNDSDTGLQPLLDRLNKAYDSFVDTYGHFNKNTAISFLRNDVDFPNVFSLERYEETGDKKGNRVQKFGKTDVFSRRVVEKEKEPNPTNVKDGIIASVYKFGHIDTAYISEQLGESEDAIRRDILENGYGFEDPTTRRIEVSYQYLSGNVREKLRQAQENNQNGEYDKNIKALQEILPMDIPAHLIDFTLGSSWIDPKLYVEYVKDRTDVDVKFTAVGGTWFMDAPAEWRLNNEKNRSMGVFSAMFNRNIFGHTLIEAAMQNKSITVSQTRRRYDNSTETITDKEATQACSVKIDEIRSDFKDWARQKMQNDSEMSAVIEREYNDMFNNYVPMSIPDEFVPEYFGGASHKFKMRPHQGRAIVRGTMQPLLLAHEVGTGKTFTLISTAMEMRRLGTARKPMIVVQNATVGQFVASAKELYPNAKILTLEEADRSAEGRKNFYAKIRYNDWDMIVVPQSTFEFIPDSEERQMAYIQSKIEEKMLVLDQMKDADPRDNSVIARQARQEIEKLRDELADLTEQASAKRSAAAEKKRAVSLQNAEVQARELLDRRTDDIENFDDMGIDALLVDEAHEYKHLGFATAMQRGVKGVDPSPSKKSQGVYLKTQAVLEKNNGRNVVFATGTPISNTAAEIWTFMRYLMPEDTMKEYGIYYFDDFVRNFGNIQQMLEFNTSAKFKENNRFAGYVNLPELVRIWSGVSDTVLTKEAEGVNDEIPDIEGGKAQDIYLPQTSALRGIMKFVRAELDAYDKMSGKEKKENSHIPLTMYGIAKAAAVDARLVVDEAEDDPNSKTNEAVRQTLRSLKETAKYKGTVAIFADNYQNKESGFNLYDDIREKLIAQGVPAAEVVVIRSGMTVKKKLEIFNKVNRGEIRVILGSTFTLGTGVNIQERLHTLIHLDAPNRPMDYTQRNGRILRQGNLHKAMGKPVRVLRFGVEDSLDVTAYQRLKTKGAIADSIMNGKQVMTNSLTNRVLEEEEDVFGDTVAQLSGSEYAMLKNNAEKNVRKYESRKKQWEAHQTYIHNAKPRLIGLIAESDKLAERNKQFLQAVQAAFPNGTFDEITIGKKTFATIDEAADFIKDHNKSILDAAKKMKDTAGTDTQVRELTISVGNFTFKVRTELSKEMFRGGGQLFSEVHRKMTYSCPELGLEDVPVHQSLLRNAVDDIVQNVITGKDFSERIEAAENRAAHDRSELKQLLSGEGIPFEYDKELKQAREQLREYSELMKKEMAEKEAKYAEMDATVETADVISDLDDDDIMRDNGMLDSVHPKVARREMAEQVNNLAKKLHLDNVEVVTRVSGLQGKKATAKGFYTKSTGKITIVVPNNTSLADVQRTLLHEAVAHYGLRQMFGAQFDTFLDNVFNNADTEVHERIVALAAKNGWDSRKATEEYLAQLAENTEFEQARQSSWWQKIKDLFVDMLRKIGFADFGSMTLTDNELRYILWRSYENLKEGAYSSVLSEATDTAKQYELNVGKFDPENDILLRDGDPEIHERALARDRYERRVKSGMYQSREAIQDSMLGLKEAMLAILGKKTYIEDVDGFENAYLGENRLSSVNKAEADAFAHLLFRPMLDEVARLAPTALEREELTDYMMAKHGLERNRVMAERDFNEYQQAHPNGGKTIDDFRERDYAGLTALTGMDNVVDAEAEAERMVADYENDRKTADLWEKVNAVSKAILKKSYDCGMMNKQTFDEVSDMYEYYIPLRGFDEKTSAEAYAYLSHKQSAFNAPIKKAQGRKSKADDPFANLQSMAESAIVQGNRNKLVKQKFLNFVLNHPSDLVSVSDLWLQYDNVTDEWRPVFPDNIDIDDTPDVVERKMQDFETKMSSLAEADPDTYKRGRDAVNIPYRVVESRDLRQHQVIVKRNGRDYLLTINGNPRAAQALNGLTNPDNDTSGAIGAILRSGEKINRQLSAFYTTRNPDFIVSNFARDMLYTNSMVWIKESPNYALRYHRNYVTKANPAKMKILLAKHRKGTLDMNDKTEAMFYQFMMNGGETGYANVRDIEQHKNDIRKELKKAAGGKISVREAWDLLGEQFDELNRAIENCARFAAYMTSREMGRSLDRSIYDAKEISVNFNKKGSGAKFYDAVGQTTAGNASALVSGLGRSGYVFWNAAVQGTTNFGRQAKRHPAKAFTGMAAMFLLGAIIAYLGGDDDDDKNAYYNLPEYVRRSNILFRKGDNWVSIPLPVEYRAIYGMGELMMSIMNGKEHMTDEELAEAIAGQVSQILPIDFLEGGGGLNAFIPSSVKPLWEAYVVEKSWTGMPLYKNTPYNKDMPEWTKAYSSSNKYIVGLANALNESTGGDKYTEGSIDLNPAKIEYMLNGYFGGVFGTIDKLTKTAETVVGTREYDPRSILLMNRLVKAGDERTEYRAVNKEYFRLKEEHDRLKARLKHYEEDTDNGVFDYAEKIDFLHHSPEYRRYEIFEDYRRDIDALYDELKEAIDDEDRKDIEAELNEVKKEMISEINRTRNRK